MRVLVVGGGGREHAIVWRLAQNPTVDRIFAAPGNAGIAREATCREIAPEDVREVAAFVERESIDLTVVGPEAPLVAGLVDELASVGHLVFGPSQQAALIEGSKAWAKELCARYGVPAARSATFTDARAATEGLDEFEPPYVVKADGLAAGKGVTVTADRGEAEAAIRASLVDLVFGEAGAKVLLEEFLAGPEVSAFALTDGKEVLPLAMAQDFKRAGEGDSGPNTGGMGAYSPPPFVDEAMERTIHEAILRRAVEAMAAEGIRYTGVLYAGLVVTEEGPKVLEFNCRMGDPETQALVPRLRSDLGELFLAATEGNLGNYKLHWSPEACVTVVLASGGYPGEYRTGLEVRGIADAEELDGVVVFHAGTTQRRGKVVTSGGRVLAVSAVGKTIGDARALAYEACNRISFEGMHYRRDVALAAAGGGE